MVFFSYHNIISLFLNSAHHFSSSSSLHCAETGTTRWKYKTSPNFFSGFRRRSLSDLSKRGRSKRSYWIDNPGSDTESVEYKVYQIEDIEGRASSPRSQVNKVI